MDGFFLVYSPDSFHVRAVGWEVAATWAWTLSSITSATARNDKNDERSKFQVFNNSITISDLALFNSKHLNFLHLFSDKLHFAFEVTLGLFHSLDIKQTANEVLSRYL